MLEDVHFHCVYVCLGLDLYVQRYEVGLLQFPPTRPCGAPIEVCVYVGGGGHSEGTNPLF